MMRIDLDPMWYYKEKHEAWLAEARCCRMLREAFGAGRPRRAWAPRLLARLGKWLASLGSGLEARYGAKVEGAGRAPAEGLKR